MSSLLHRPATSDSGRRDRAVVARRGRLIAAPAVAAALVAAPVFLGSDSSFGLPEAAAHDQMIGANPEPDSTISETPESIELEFSGIPRDDFNTVALSEAGDGGEVLVTDEPELDDQFITLDIPDDVTLTDGEYTVGYRITSSDGHATPGSYNFTFSADGEVVDAQDTAGEDTDDSELPAWTGTALGITGVIVVAGVLVMLIARYRNMSSNDTESTEGTEGTGDTEGPDDNRQ